MAEGFCELRAYDGSAPYIFVSYAHKDAGAVLPVLEYLMRRGYNVWYDEGITPGADWDDFLARKIAGCACFLCFASARSVASAECVKEMRRAIACDRPILNVFLENVALPAEVAGPMMRIQGIERWRLASESDFYLKLLAHHLFDDCLESEEFLIQGKGLVHYNGTASTIAVPADVEQIGYAAFEGNDQAVVVRIPAAVDRMGKFAFNDVPRLQRIEVAPGNGFYRSRDGILFNKAENYLLRYPPARPGSDYRIPSTVRNVAMVAFAGTRDLRQVAVPPSVTMIGDRCFEACRNLVAVDLRASIDRVRPYTFSRCAGLVEIALPSGLRAIGDGAFSGCASLSAIELPEGLGSLGEMAFAYCESLEAVRVPAGVRAIGEYCFHECASLASVDLGAVEAIGQYAFKNCEALREVRFPAGLGTIGRAAFSGCRSLASVELPDAVAVVGDYAFDRCAALRTVRCGRGLRRIEEGAFAEDGALERVVLPRTVEYVAPGAIPAGVEVAFLD